MLEQFTNCKIQNHSSILLKLLTKNLMLTSNALLLLVDGHGAQKKTLKKKQRSMLTLCAFDTMNSKHAYWLVRLLTCNKQFVKFEGAFSNVCCD